MLLGLAVMLNILSHTNWYELCTLVVTEESKIITNSLSSCKMEIKRKRTCFEKAGQVAFEMLSERRAGAEQSYRIETGID
jgi:hypothetical protein